MSVVNFNIRDTKATRKTSINLIFFYDGSKLKMSTGRSIHPKYWNENKQRAKELMEFSDHIDLNEYLDQLETVMLSIYNGYRRGGIVPDSDTLKQDFLTSKDNPISTVRLKSFWEYFEEFITYKKRFIKDMRDYDKSLRKHLIEGEKLFGMPLTFEAIKKQQDSFVERWRTYLEFEAINSFGEDGLAANTIGKQNKNLKVFLNWCFDNEICQKFSVKHLPSITEDVDKIYLKEEELVAIEKLVLDGEEDLVRDLFLVGCETALRFSDFTRISESAFVDDTLHFRPKKTENSVVNNKVVIPISKRFQKIREKYKDGFPKYDSKKVSSFNKTLREVCKKAEINDVIYINRKVGGKRIQTKYYKYEQVSSHTCRRTFCTLKYHKRMDTQAIMKFSGHKSERNFKKYLKLDAEIVAEENKQYF
jgi:integrase